MAELSIDIATDSELELLSDLEARADQIYLNMPELKAMVALPNASAQDYRQLPASKRIWIAKTKQPVGFTYARDLDDCLYLGQLSVVPEAQNKGVGAALLNRVLDHARTGGKKGVLLFTYANVPWNAPFYAKRGFRILGEHELGPQTNQLAMKDKKNWARFSSRVVMGYFFNA